MNTSAKPSEVHCPLCELRMSETLNVVSRHRTSTGTVVYARCECGRLSMWLEPAAAMVRRPEWRLMARRRRASAASSPD